MEQRPAGSGGVVGQRGPAVTKPSFSSGDGVACEDAEGGEEFGGWMDFSNLQEVLLSVVRKFKAQEARLEGLSEGLEHATVEIGKRAYSTRMQEGLDALSTRADNLQLTLQLQKESLRAIESMVDHNKGILDAVETKLEAFDSQRAVQERSLTQVTEMLLDKVSTAELRAFQSRFADFAPRREIQAINERFRDYASKQALDHFDETIRRLTNRLEDYSRTAWVEKRLKELRNTCTEEFALRAKEASVARRFEDLKTATQEQFNNLRWEVENLGDKTRATSDRISSCVQDLTKELQSCALSTDLEALEFKVRDIEEKVRARANLEDHGPKLAELSTRIGELETKNLAVGSAIMRLDETILDKASKSDVHILNSRLVAFADSEHVDRELDRIDNRICFVNEKLEQYVDNEAKRMKAVMPKDHAAEIDELRTTLLKKANHSDFTDFIALKANRIDTDEHSKLLETVHRQLEYLAVTCFGMAKLSMTEAATSENKTIRLQQKAQVLMQSEALWRWILRNEEPPNLDTLRPPGAAAAAVGVMARERAHDASWSPPTSKSVMNSPRFPKIVPPMDPEKRHLDLQQRKALELKLGTQVW